VPQPIQAVIFDFDGTLIDTFPAIHAGFNAAIAPLFGRDFSRDEVIDRFGPPDEGILAIQLKDHSNQVLQDAIEVYYAAYEKSHDSMAPFEGIEALLQELRKLHLPLGVMTGKSRRAADITIAHFGWQDKFDVLVTGDEVPNFKPAPDGPLLAAKLLGIAPENCMYVGDSPADLGAARSAHMMGVVAGWQSYFQEKLRPMNPEYWANTPADVLNLCR
jgi:pyrophosphatase PpaX